MSAPLPLAPEPPRITAHGLHQMLSARYARPEWHLEGEVTLEGRRLDALAFNLWAARERRIIGFEVKVSRADLMRELRDHTKAEGAARWLDAFYLVIPSRLCTPDEVPAGWGLLEAQGSRLVTRRQPVFATYSASMSRELAARLIDRLARSTEEDARREVALLRGEIEARTQKQYDERHAQHVEQERAELTTLRANHAELLGVLGVESRAWDAHESALRAAGVYARLARDGTTVRRQLERAQATLSDQLAALRGALDALPVEAEP